METVEIRIVRKGTPLAAELVRFIEDFSWLEVKEHTLAQLESWDFEDWETPFAALSDGGIVAMATIMKTDYYPQPEIFPWISTIFVTESHRGNHISGKLIDVINRYAARLGFSKTYIPSEHIGLYEKYGYRYVKDIVNYGGGTDRLYEKELTSR